MRSLAITNQKGGSGKSTLSVNLAVEAARRGERVLVLDTDPQGSAVSWAATRGAGDPEVEGVETARVPIRLYRARREGITLVIIDTQPRAEVPLAALLRAVDFAIVPLRPSTFDIATLQQTLRLILASGRPGCIVLNSCPARAPEIARTREATQGLGLTLAPIELGERRAYMRAVASGRGVSEFEPTGPAAMEIASLWSYLEGRLAPNEEAPQAATPPEGAHFAPDPVPATGGESPAASKLGESNGALP
ncbi:MAG: AAA family ATPase [Vulcanimicrobiaceae bacterium]